jgi:hypothetical protein
MPFGAETSRRLRGLHRVSWTGWERLYDLRATAHRAWRPSHGERQMKWHALRRRRPAVPVDCTGYRGRAGSVSTSRFLTLGFDSMPFLERAERIPSPRARPGWGRCRVAWVNLTSGLLGRLAAFSRGVADGMACPSAETSRRPRGLHRVSWTGWERLYKLILGRWGFDPMPFPERSN